MLTTPRSPSYSRTKRVKSVEPNAKTCSLVSTQGQSLSSYSVQIQCPIFARKQSFHFYRLKYSDLNITSPSHHGEVSVHVFDRLALILCSGVKARRHCIIYKIGNCLSSNSHSSWSFNTVCRDRSSLFVLELLQVNKPLERHVIIDTSSLDFFELRLQAVFCSTENETTFWNFFIDSSRRNQVSRGLSSILLMSTSTIRKNSPNVC